VSSAANTAPDPIGVFHGESTAKGHSAGSRGAAAQSKISKKACSFLKKRTKRLLFLRCTQLSGHGLDRGGGGELRVFWFMQGGLRLFFRKGNYPGKSETKKKV
jgi:hypothetical protein